jgi:hypothetical protein
LRAIYSQRLLADARPRNLQAAALDDLLAKVIDARERVQKNAAIVGAVKIAPDRSLTELGRASARRPLAPGRRHDRG